MSIEATRATAVEQRSIDRIPPEERHGKPWHLFTIWFSSNLQITGLVTGALSVAVGLSLGWAFVTILVGNAVGALFMAYHSVQGSQLGVPQMIQSRAQFGFIGAILPVVLVLCMYTGFSIEGGVVTGHALAAWLDIPFALSVAIQTAIGSVVAIVGYNLIHLASRLVTVTSTILFAVLTLALIDNVPSGAVDFGSADFGTILLAVSIFVSWQITWAPYVSDYSRYLPEDTKPSVTFAWTYAGSVIGATWVMGLGAVGAAISAEAMGADAIGFLSAQIPGLGGVVLVALLVSVVPAGAYGAYGAYLTSLSVVSARGTGRATPMVRTLFIAVFSVLTALVTIAASGNILHTVQDITLLLLSLLIPWTAINLADYYVVRKGQYDLEDLFDPHGQYGLVRWPAIVIYLVTIFAQLPFISNRLFEGPVAAALGGADISWIVGLLLPGALYIGWARLRHQPQGQLSGQLSA